MRESIIADQIKRERQLVFLRRVACVAVAAALVLGLVLAYHDQAIMADAKYASFYHERGDAHLARGDFDHAIADFETASIAYSAKGDFERAIATYNQAKKLRGDLGANAP